MKSIIKSFILFLFFASSFTAFSQNAVTMMVIDAETLQPLSGVEVQIIETGELMVSDENGQFTISKENITTESISLRFRIDDYFDKSYSMDVSSFNEKTLIYSISPIKEQVESDIPVISIDVAEDNDEDLGRVSGILNASRDAFVSAAFFNFSSARFRIRGYDSENTISYFNHTPANDLDNGRESYYAWGGLNDVTRLRSSTIGLALNDNSFGGMGGVNTLDSRASLQRKQFRVTYSMTNRSYRNRLMATYSTGWLKNGWAFSLSASRRWAQEGYVPGTFYDGYSYFASIDKKLGDNHRLNLTLLGAPVKSGRSSATSEEWKGIAGTNYYNPYWGFQNGEKRNSRIATSHQPFGILRYDFTKRQDFALTASASLRTGKYGTTNITWYDAKDPRVNRYNPYNIQDQATRESVLDLLTNNEAARQMDWDYMYEVNRLREDEVYDSEGNLIASGLESDYILEEKRYDVTQGAGNITANWILSNTVTLSGGIQHIDHQTHKYKLVDDLLGGEFIVDLDKFAQRDFSTEPDKWQSDLDNPDRVVKEDDVFGYDYKGHTRQSKGWLQASFSWPRIDAFLSAQGDNTKMWREGLMRNGKFPEISKGDSEKKSFLSPQGKAGVTYKINGRNYIYATGAYIERAPFFRNVFLSPQVRNTWIPDITTEKIQGFEAGYTLNAPDVKATIRGYHTTFADGIVNRRFFLTSTFGGGEYINYIMSDIEKLHQGIEFGARWNITSALSAEGAAAVGQYIYTNRPNVNIIVDNNATEFEEVPTVYIKDFYLPGMPQQAYSLGFRYRSPNYWSVSLTGNYFDEAWLDFFPNRRTVNAVDNPGVEYGSDLYEQIIYQEKLPAAFTLNFFGSKSWKFKKHFIYLNVAVNNILNNQFLTGGYEQFKFDFEDLDLDRYPNRYYNAYGTNFYFSISYKY